MGGGYLLDACARSGQAGGRSRPSSFPFLSLMTFASSLVDHRFLLFFMVGGVSEDSSNNPVDAGEANRRELEPLRLVHICGENRKLVEASAANVGEGGLERR